MNKLSDNIRELETEMKNLIPVWLDQYREGGLTPSEMREKCSGLFGRFQEIRTKLVSSSWTQTDNEIKSYVQWADAIRGYWSYYIEDKTSLTFGHPTPIHTLGSELLEERRNFKLILNRKFDIPDEIIENIHNLPCFVAEGLLNLYEQYKHHGGHLSVAVLAGEAYEAQLMGYHKFSFLDNMLDIFRSHVNTLIKKSPNPVGANPDRDTILEKRLFPYPFFLTGYKKKKYAFIPFGRQKALGLFWHRNLDLLMKPGLNSKENSPYEEISIDSFWSIVSFIDSHNRNIRKENKKFIVFQKGYSVQEIVEDAMLNLDESNGHERLQTLKRLSKIVDLSYNNDTRFLEKHDDGKYLSVLDLGVLGDALNWNYRVATLNHNADVPIGIAFTLPFFVELLKSIRTVTNLWELTAKLQKTFSIDIINDMKGLSFEKKTLEKCLQPYCESSLAGKIHSKLLKAPVVS